MDGQSYLLLTNVCYYVYQEESPEGGRFKKEVIVDGQSYLLLTNVYYYVYQEESPEGGRFKKEVIVDGQSYLLLIRDEGGPPELQVPYIL